MQQIQLPNNLILILPVGYKKIPLPGLTEWAAALRTRKDRGTFTLRDSNSCYCCLGVLSQLQGRLTPLGADGDGWSASGLAPSNPLFEVLRCNGYLPDGVKVHVPANPSMAYVYALSSVSDSLETGEGWEIIPVILGYVYYDPKAEHTSTDDHTA